MTFASLYILRVVVTVMFVISLIIYSWDMCVFLILLIIFTLTLGKRATGLTTVALAVVLYGLILLLSKL